MKKLVCALSIIAGLLSLNSCSMKECNCYSTNEIIQSDTLVRYTVDTVFNYTRGDCEMFNKIDEPCYMEDSTIVIYHTLTCQEN